MRPLRFPPPGFRPSASLPRLRGSFLLLGLPQTSRDCLHPYSSRHALPFLPHSLFLTQSHSPLHHTIYPNSITSTLYHSHTFNGPHYSENGEVTSNAILNRGKSIDRFSLLFFTLFLHPHTYTISISPFTILYFLPSSLSFHSHLRQSDD